MRKGLGGVGSEGQLGPEHGLTLQSGSLPDEQVVKVALERLLVNVEDLVS